MAGFSFEAVIQSTPPLLSTRFSLGDAARKLTHPHVLSGSSQKHSLRIICFRHSCRLMGHTSSGLGAALSAFAAEHSVEAPRSATSKNEIEEYEAI
jgi:hypothetical protein